MEEGLRRYVSSRAGDRCEYCRLRQEHETLTPFHVEHVIAAQHGGTDEDGNLALACAWCNLIKGPNIASLDPSTGRLTRLSHPRQDSWEDHFRRDGPQGYPRPRTGWKRGVTQGLRRNKKNARPAYRREKSAYDSGAAAQ